MSQTSNFGQALTFFFFTIIETNAVFTKLGAEDIVARYDKLLHEWKLLKDAEQDFKKIMGLDYERPLVKCLDSIPPGTYTKFSQRNITFFMYGTGFVICQMHLQAF